MWWCSTRRGSGQARRSAEALFRRVARQGDGALRKAAGVPGEFVYSRAEFRRAFGRLGASARAALEAACRHHGALARRELASLKQYEARPTSGVTVYHRRVPLARVGVVVPASRVSVLLAGAIPAAVAGVETRVVCTPVGAGGEADANDEWDALGDERSGGRRRSWTPVEPRGSLVYRGWGL